MYIKGVKIIQTAGHNGARTVFRILKKKKRSAKSIYKLIDDLEKKYIY